MGEIPKGWTVKPVDNAPPEGWDVQVGDPDFSDVQGGAESKPTPNTYQQPTDKTSARIAGFLNKFPGPEAVSWLQQHLPFDHGRPVSPDEIRGMAGAQKAISPDQYGQGEMLGRATPSILTAIGTGGASLPQQAGAQGLTAYLQSRLAGKSVAGALPEAATSTALTGAGGMLGIGLGNAAQDASAFLAPKLRELARSAALKQSGFAVRMGSLFKRKGEEGIEQMAEDLLPQIRPTVQWTNRNLGNIVNNAETMRGSAVQELDKALENNPAMPTLGDVVNNAKNQLAKAVRARPSLKEHATTVQKTLDNYLEQWGPESKSFTAFDDLRRQIADLGQFDNTVAKPLQSLYRATSGAIREDIDNVASYLAPGDEAQRLLASKDVLHRYIEPANMAAERAHVMGSHSTIGIPGTAGIGSALTLAGTGHIGPAAVAAVGSLLQKPARQWANYGMAKGAQGLSAYLGSEAPGVGGFLGSQSGEATSGVAGSLMSKRLFPNQVGQLAERLGAPQAAQLKSAAETDPANADALHKYMLANNQDYQAVMGTAGTSKDRRQP